MKHIPLLVIAVATTSVALNAAPFMAVGDSAELFVTAAAEIQSDSNIYLKSTNEQDDIVYSFTPGVDMVFGKGAVTKGNVYYREEIRRYADNDNQDTTLSNVGANSTYSNGLTKVSLNSSYAQIAQNDLSTIGLAQAGVIARREVFNLGGSSEFSVSEKTALGVGATYANTNYATASYTDSEIWTLPLDVYYKATPKMDWSLGYRYRNTNLSGSAVDSSDNYFNIGARGEFTPKLVGQIRVGYNTRSLDVGPSQGQFAFDGNLKYAYSAKTSVTLVLGNDFSSSGTGDSTKNFNIGVSASSRLTEQLALNAAVNFRSTKYPTRKDDFTEGVVGVSYDYNAYVKFGASFAARENASDNLAAADYVQNVFSISANIRY